MTMSILQVSRPIPRTLTPAELYNEPGHLLNQIIRELNLRLLIDSGPEWLGTECAAISVALWRLPLHGPQLERLIEQDRAGAREFMNAIADDSLRQSARTMIVQALKYERDNTGQTKTAHQQGRFLPTWIRQAACSSNCHSILSLKWKGKNFTELDTIVPEGHMQRNDIRSFIDDHHQAAPMILASLNIIDGRIDLEHPINIDWLLAHQPEQHSNLLLQTLGDGLSRWCWSKFPEQYGQIQKDIGDTARKLMSHGIRSRGSREEAMSQFSQRWHGTRETSLRRMAMSPPRPRVNISQIVNGSTPSSHDLSYICENENDHTQRAQQAAGLLGGYKECAHRLYQLSITGNDEELKELSDNMPYVPRGNDILKLCLTLLAHLAREQDLLPLPRSIQAQRLSEQRANPQVSEDIEMISQALANVMADLYTTAMNLVRVDQISDSHRQSNWTTPQVTGMALRLIPQMAGQWQPDILREQIRQSELERIRKMITTGLMEVVNA